MLARLILLPLALLLMGNAPAASPWLTLDQLKAKYQDSQSHYATIAGLPPQYGLYTAIVAGIQTAAQTAR